VGLTPTVRIIANSKDITAKIADRLASIVVTDETGEKNHCLKNVEAK